MAPGAPVAVVGGLDPAGAPNGHLSYVRAHALALEAVGFDPHVFCVAGSDGVEQTDYGTLHRVATRIRHDLFAPTFSRTLAAAVADYLRGSGRLPPYLIHAFGPWGDVAVHATALLAADGLRAIPVVSAYDTIISESRDLLRGVDSDHGLGMRAYYFGSYAWQRAIGGRSERRGCRGARLLLVNYEAVANAVQTAHGPLADVRRIPYAPASAFASEPNGSLLDPRALAGLEPSDAPLIVSVSRHNPRKGIDVLLRALAQLRSHDISFRAALIGPGRLLEVHRSLADRLGISRSVAVPGAVPDVRPFLRAADVFVLPSLSEGSGSVSLIEALQAGIPVIATGVDGIPEDVVDGESGLLVPPRDAAALCDALAKLLRDPSLRARLASAARETYEQRFSADVFTEALRRTYGELGVEP
jgi:glycosyltransferase involved in cell wall biosynthesis